MSPVGKVFGRSRLKAIITAAKKIKRPYLPAIVASEKLRPPLAGLLHSRSRRRFRRRLALPSAPGQIVSHGFPSSFGVRSVRAAFATRGQTRSGDSAQLLAQLLDGGGDRVYCRVVLLAAPAVLVRSWAEGFVGQPAQGRHEVGLP